MNKLIALLVLIQNCVIAQIQVPPRDGLDLFNIMMRHLFNNCRTEFGTIGFWGDDRIFLADDEADFVLLNKSKVFKEPPTRRIKFLVVILDKFDWSPQTYINEAMPTLEIETMFVFARRIPNLYKDYSMTTVFDWFQEGFENSKVYYCTPMKGKIEILTINAFADIAPAFWVDIDDVYIDYNYDSRKIFKAHYNEKTQFNYAGSELCENIFFDRTEKLNGYKIKALAKLRSHYGSEFFELNEFITKDTAALQVTSMLQETERPFIKFLTDYLDVSVNITHGMPSNNTLDISDLLLDHTLDLGLTPINWITGGEKYDLFKYFSASYPSLFFNDVIVTHNRGLSSPLEKMFEFYGWLTIVATLVILVMSLIVIYLSNSENSSRLSFAVFECLRLLINNSIYTRMDTAKMRFFFSVIFLYFLIIQATFSGHLASFLTKPVYRKNVETLEDLKDPHYTTIYSHIGGLTYITDPVLLNKTKFEDFECEKHIDDKSVACIDYTHNLDQLIIDYNLHTPKNSVKFAYAWLTMRHNWALRHRVNNLIMRLDHSGIKDFLTEKLKQPINQELRKIHDIADNYQRPIELGDVTFAFYLLAVGLFLAFVSFSVEYFVKICRH